MPVIYKLVIKTLALAHATIYILVSAQHTHATYVNERISVNSFGIEGNDHSSAYFSSDLLMSPTRDNSVSGDGRYVALESAASNLVNNDSNGLLDIFVKDRKTNTIERVSLGVGDSESNGSSYQPSISADGRYIAFTSDASNLVNPADHALPPGQARVYLYDREIEKLRLVSIPPSNLPNFVKAARPTIDANGNYIAFTGISDPLIAGNPPVANIFLYSKRTETTKLISKGTDGMQGNGWSDSPVVSSDGRYVAFDSYASNLVPNDSNNVSDIFIRDQQTGITQRVSLGEMSVEADGHSENATISSDGRYVAFDSYASNLVPNDSNNVSDIFIRDQQTGITQRVSVNATCNEIAGPSYKPAISGDGQYVAFQSHSSHLDFHSVDPDIAVDVYVRDLSRPTCKTVRRVSKALSGLFEPDRMSYGPSISSNGQYIAFQSQDHHLVRDDTNNKDDVFINYLSQTP